MENKSTKTFLLGSIVASILASACCIGPIIFAILGISSAGLMNKFDSYRGIISVVALTFLAVSFYFTYKKKPTEECAENSICANPKSDVWNKRILWLTTAMIITILSFPHWSIYLMQ